MRKIPVIALGILVSLATTVSAAVAPQTFPLGIKDGKLTGPGGDMIRAELPKAQFILYGEDHGFADSSIVLHAIAREARPSGFKYHLVEVGPVTTRMISATLTRDGLAGLHQLVHDNPFGFPFLSLKDDAELASDFLGRDAKGTQDLWGVDQEFLGSPTLHLQRLIEIAPGESTRAAVGKLLADEKEATAKGGKFLLSRFHDTAFDSLAAQFKGQTEAENIIAELKESAAIYQLWSSNRNYENNARRARLLTKNFLANYKSAADPQPKVIFKMGIEHVALGTTTINTFDLGTLATSIARANGKSALRIAFLPMGGHNLGFAPKPGNPTSVEVYDGPEGKEFFGAIGLEGAALAKEGWTLVPLEPIRQSLDNKGIDALKPFSRFLLLGFDYVVTTTDAKAAVSLY